jgi:hypothetical protein
METSFLYFFSAPNANAGARYIPAGKTPFPTGTLTFAELFGFSRSSQTKKYRQERTLSKVETERLDIF